MNLHRRTLLASFVVVILALAGTTFVSPQTSVVVQIAAAILPSETPTATATPTASSTATITPTETQTPTPSETPTATPTSSRTPTLAPTRTRVPTATATPTVSVAKVPILMYHYVSVPPADADKYRLDLSVTPANFESQLTYFQANGYHPIKLSDLTDFLRNGTPLPDKPIVLTFDDGYADNYANAYPLLKKFNFPGTFFVVAQWIEDKRWGYMSWTQLDEMVKGGMEIGSHTLNHNSLQRKSRAYQTGEIVGSKELIEKRLGVPITSFSYPLGDYDAITLSIVTSAGYHGAVTEIQSARQSSTNINLLRRIRIRGSYSVADVEHWIKWNTENGK